MGLRLENETAIAANILEISVIEFITIDPEWLMRVSARDDGNYSVGGLCLSVNDRYLSDKYKYGVRMAGLPLANSQLGGTVIRMTVGGHFAVVSIEGNIVHKIRETEQAARDWQFEFTEGKET